MGKEYWITNSRFKIILIVILIVWFTLIIFLFTMGEAIRKNPCQICANKMGEKVTCYMFDEYNLRTRERTFIPEPNKTDSEYNFSFGG